MKLIKIWREKNPVKLKIHQQSTIAMHLIKLDLHSLEGEFEELAK